MRKKKMRLYARFHLLLFCDYWEESAPWDDVIREHLSATKQTTHSADSQQLIMDRFLIDLSAFGRTLVTILSAFTAYRAILKKRRQGRILMLRVLSEIAGRRPPRRSPCVWEIVNYTHLSCSNRLSSVSSLINYPRLTGLNVFHTLNYTYIFWSSHRLSAKPVSIAKSRTFLLSIRRQIHPLQA